MKAPRRYDPASNRLRLNTLIRLRWLAILSPKFNGSLACSGGVHSATDAVKAIMAGADSERRAPGGKLSGAAR